MKLLFTPVSAAVLKSAEWTRRRIFEDREFYPTPHFNQRINEAGQMSLDEAFEVVREGSSFTCRPHPTLYRFAFVWNSKVVIADSIMDRNYSDNSKVSLITCYDRDKPLGDGSVDRLPLNEKSAQVGAVKAVEDADARIASLTQRRSQKNAEETLADRAKLEGVKTRLATEIAKLEELLSAMRMELDELRDQLGEQRT